MRYWNELRTALVVARTGTVRAAAAELGVHRATVHRHIELLEGALGTKLFFRNARGYSLTDDGFEMLNVAGRADEMFSDFEGSMRKSAGQLSGDLVLAIFHGLGSVLMPAIKAMRETHPDVSIELVADEKLSRLEHGEAHVAFRAGQKPTVQDYVVQPFLHLKFGLYASREYVSEYGRPIDDDFTGHKFIGPVGARAARPYAEWLAANTTPDDFMLNTSSRVCIHQAIMSGLGLGFMADFEARDNSDLIEIIPPTNDVSLPVWLVTHMDIHRTAKVQAFLEVLKASNAEMNGI